MLTREEKIKNAQTYIGSEKFGIDTFKTLYLFNTNVQYALLGIKLNGILQTKLDDKGITHNLTDDELLRVKHTMILDVIMKIEIIIESTLILLDALSRDYKHVPQMMTRYNFNLLPKIIKKIRKGDYNLRKILALPDIGSLPISAEERRFLGNLYLESTHTVQDSLLEMIEFYQQFNIIYSKSKHGLSFVLGLSQTLDPTKDVKPLNSKGSLIQCIDKKDKTDMPPGYIISLPKDQTYNLSSLYFNTVSILKVDDTLFDKITRMKSILGIIISFICDNHLTYAANCGETYLPVVRKSKEVGVRMVTLNWNDDIEAKLKEIFNKILPYMNTNELNLDTVFKSENPLIIESLAKNVVTNIWLSDGTEEKKSIFQKFLVDLKKLKSILK